MLIANINQPPWIQTLVSVFAYSTNRLKIRAHPSSPLDPQGFLRSLFLSSAVPPSDQTPNNMLGPRRKQPRRSASQTDPRSYTRSYSYPNELRYVGSQIISPTPKSATGFDNASPLGSFLPWQHQSASPSTSVEFAQRIYGCICPMDHRERHAIHKSLVHFSFIFF